MFSLSCLLKFVCVLGFIQIASTEEDDLAGLEDVSSDDEEDNNEAEWIDSEMISSGNVSGRKGSKKKSRGISVSCNIIT